ncbi:MAG: HAMP domain-containing sensor histidine kinase [Actinomycetota bacterium]|nr:HAMP domain-containing sensor histidine kinase [Actinomycetota bacterium]
MEYKRNLMRMLGGTIWVIIPIVSLMIFLPHRLEINYEATLILLFFILLTNLTIMLLPFRESLLQKHFDILSALFRAGMIVLICVAIYFTGGIRSPLFTLLLLVTAFSTSLNTSLSSFIIFSAISVGTYLVTVLAFSAVYYEDAQLLSAQVFFLLLISFFINRISAESREQAQERANAMVELKRLSEIDRATSSFVSSVSFEMRTPLTSIQGFSEILVSRELDAEKEQEYVEIISREADTLSMLVEDLLDISRLESGKVHLNKEVSRLDQLLNMSLPVLARACDPDRVATNIPPDLPSVMVDPQRMKRVFDAVFGYIARKSGRGSEVRASAKAEGEEVVITINFRNRETAAYRKNGGRLFPPPGMQDEEDLELAMAHRIVLAHNGSVNLIRASGGWFAIVLRLPEMKAGDFMKNPTASTGTFEESTA